MATQGDINDAHDRLRTIWSNPPARDETFGNILRNVTIRSVRGFTGTVEFRWPVVAVAGTNGSGKTTLLQVCSAAYSREGYGSRHYTLGRWIGPARRVNRPSSFRPLPSSTPSGTRPPGSMCRTNPKGRGGATRAVAIPREVSSGLGSPITLPESNVWTAPTRTARDSQSLARTGSTSALLRAYRRSSTNPTSMRACIPSVYSGRTGPT